MVDEKNENRINNDESLKNGIHSHDFEMGYAMGEYKTQEIAHKAYTMGEIDLWIAWSKPKTIEEWEQWYAEHGENFEERWKSPDKGF